MKAYFFVILFGALAMYSCANCEGPATSVSDCEKRTLPAGGYRCCFVDFKVTVMGEPQITKECGSLTKEEYDNIDKVLEDGKKRVEEFDGKIDKFSIDCNSNYIIISMLTLLLLFL